MSRFSDEELTIMSQKLELHMEEFRAHIEAENLRWESVLSLQERNAEQIEKLTKSTEGMIEAWQVATGGMKFLVLVGNFAKWLASLAVFAAIAHWFGWIGDGK